MVLFRALGWSLLVLAVAAVVQNALTAWSEGAFRVLTLADLWGHAGPGSFAAFQRFLGSDGLAHDTAIVLGLPAAPVFFIVALVLLWFGQPPGEGRTGLGSARALGAGRRPRRKRGRGLS
jgi:hypothetical protein